jgi:hypothetical protein
MMKRVIVASVLVAALATPALAGQCPGDMRKIDAALETASLPDDVLANVMVLREKGEAEHAAGKHGDSVASLAAAMSLIMKNS